MKNLTELQPLIIEWAKNKNLVFPENAPKQRLKLIEECGELASAILKNDVKLQKDAIGDIFVVLVILAEQTSDELIIDIVNNFTDSKLSLDYLISHICYSLSTGENLVETDILTLDDISKLLNLDLTECANIAWNEIKNRTGQTIDGTFVKD